MAKTHRLVLLTGSAAIFACTAPRPNDPIVVCADPVPAFEVRIRNGLTGQFIGANAVVVATTGRYADTVHVANDSLAVFVGIQPGTYSVVVMKPAYVNWQVAGVVVPAAPAPCEGNPGSHLRFDAVLQPLM